MSHHANPATLTEEQVKFYDENGFLIVPGLYSNEKCEEIKCIAETLAVEDYSVKLNVHREHDFFLGLMKDPVIVNIVKTVQRSKVFGLNDQFLYKKPGTPYAKQAWSPHQDNAYTQAPKNTYLQLHIFVDAQDEGNGGIYYYPGSNHEDILPYVYAVSHKEGFDKNGISHPGREVEIPEKYEKVEVSAPQGAICLQNGNTIHGSVPNFSEDRSRNQYSMCYINQGVSFQPGKSSVKIPFEVE